MNPTARAAPMAALSERNFCVEGEGVRQTGSVSGTGQEHGEGEGHSDGGEVEGDGVVANGVEVAGVDAHVHCCCCEHDLVVVGGVNGQ